MDKGPADRLAVLFRDQEDAVMFGAAMLQFAPVIGGKSGIAAAIGSAAVSNAYNVAIRFGAAPCFFANQSMSGIAYFDAPTKRLYAAAPNAGRTDGILFLGTKP